MIDKIINLLDNEREREKKLAANGFDPPTSEL